MTPHLSAEYAVCIKHGELIDQVVGIKSELVPGELVKIIVLNKTENFDRLVVKVYDRDNKSFGKGLYQCDKEIVKRLLDNVWAVASNLREGTNVVLQLALPGKSLNVTFRIKFYGNSPQFGAGHFFGLDITDTLISDDDKFQIRMKYYMANVAMYIIRADQLIEALVLKNLPSIGIEATKPFSLPNPNVTDALIAFDNDFPQANHPSLKMYHVSPVNTNQQPLKYQQNNNITQSPQDQIYKSSVNINLNEEHIQTPNRFRRISQDVSDIPQAVQLKIFNMPSVDSNSNEEFHNGRKNNIIQSEYDRTNNHDPHGNINLYQRESNMHGSNPFKQVSQGHFDIMHDKPVQYKPFKMPPSDSNSNQEPMDCQESNITPAGYEATIHNFQGNRNLYERELLNIQDSNPCTIVNSLVDFGQLSTQNGMEQNTSNQIYLDKHNNTERNVELAMYGKFAELSHNATGHATSPSDQFHNGSSIECVTKPTITPESIIDQKFRSSTVDHRNNPNFMSSTNQRDSEHVKDFRSSGHLPIRNQIGFEKLTVSNSILHKMSNIEDTSPMKNVCVPNVYGNEISYEPTLPNDNRMVRQPINLPNNVQPRQKSKPKNQNTENYSNMLNCLICQKTVEIKKEIQFDCQHVVCGRCLANVINNDMENAYCPFQTENFKCSYKLTVDDIQSVINSLTEPESVLSSIPNTARNDSRRATEPIRQTINLSNNVQPGKNLKPKNNHPNQNIENISNMLNCLICQKTGDNKIQLDCHHVFCGRCLVISINDDLENAYCPFQIDNFKCRYKLTVDDMQSVINSLNESDSVNQISSSTPNSAGNDSRRATEPINTDIFVYKDDGNNREVLFYCKQEKCGECWFVDKSEGINTYQCPKCETFNCFKCQAIHDKMTCEEYNKRKVRDNRNNFRHENRRNSKSEEGAAALSPASIVKQTQIWKCENCNYNENQMDTAICVICMKTNDRIMKIRNSASNEYQRLLELEQNNGFIPNFEEFECILCEKMIKPKNGVQLRGCLHNFCRACISIYIEEQDQVKIKCPRKNCTNILDDREIKSLTLRQRNGRRLNRYQCCVPNCQGSWILTDGKYKYNCTICRTENCISCQGSHPSITCKMYQQNLIYSTDKNDSQTLKTLEQKWKTGEAGKCPNCSTIVVKNGLEMYCIMCQMKFRN